MADTNAAYASVKEQILSQLNEQQRAAAVHYQGACAINAGPGSGKTKTLISRAAFMIEDGVSPYNILLFTFTRKAAGEIRDRVHSQIGEKAEGITIGTYHSFCMRLLRRYADRIGWTKNFSIYDEDDKKGILKPLAKSEDVDARLVAGSISRFKQCLLTPVAAMQVAETAYERKAAKIYESYMQQLKAANAFDFDDLIYFSIRLLEDHPDVKNEVNRRYKYVTCDEAHDSSVEDLRLIELLGGKSMNVCLILDCDQSIYSFRGANMSAVYEFMQTHGFRQFMLERNYRSTQTIVNAARSMIVRNKEPFEKCVYSENEVGPKIVCAALGDPSAESSHVVRIVKALHKQGVAYEDMAVLYRLQSQSRNVEEGLLRNGIPYRIVGGLPFYSRKEIKDVLAYMRFILNPRDVEALKRIINVPRRSIGNKSEKLILACYSQLNCAILSTRDLQKVAEKVNLSKKTDNSFRRFIILLEQLEAFSGTHTPKEFVDEVIKQTGYCDYLIDNEKDEADDKIETLLELENIAAGYSDVGEFLNTMVLNTEKQDDGVSGVNLMTMHASKGLEFPAVIMVGANEGTIPHFKAVADGDVSEERRLFYVAMTRAERFLFITRSKIMMQRGEPRFCSQSRFLSEVDPSYLEKA